MLLELKQNEVMFSTGKNFSWIDFDANEIDKIADSLVVCDLTALRNKGHSNLECRKTVAPFSRTGT